MQNKFAEFFTVLVLALLIGVGVWLAVMYLSGTALIVAVISLMILSVIIWQFLRKRFGRA